MRKEFSDLNSFARENGLEFDKFDTHKKGRAQWKRNG